MRWQRPARYAIAAAGIGFAVLLYMRYERRPAGPSAPLPPPMPADISYQSAMSPGGNQVRYKNGKEIGSWSYATMQQFTDGRRVMEMIRFAGDRDGKPYVLSADRAEMKAPNPGVSPDDVSEETHLTGHVLMHEQDGMEIKTDDATYRDSVALLDIPGQMTFGDTRTSGSGVGAIYDRNAQLLTLKDQAAIAIAKDPAGQGGFSARSTSMLLNRATHFVSLDGNATITREREVISAAGALMHLNDDNQGVQMMELHQQASIVPVAGAAQTPEMHADDITMEFQPDGRAIKRSQLFRKATLVLAGQSGRKQITGDMLDVQLAGDGQTVTHLSGNGGPVVVTLPATGSTPQRVISGRTLDSTGDEKSGLTAAVFRQDVEFSETRPAARGQAAAKRTVHARQLTLSLNAGDLSDIKDAHFRDAVDFVDRGTSGKADDVTYVAADGKLLLRPAGDKGNKSFVSTGRITVNARSIDIDLDKTVIDASGDMTTITSVDKAAVNKGLFDATKETRGKANGLHYEDAKNQAVYTGGAILRQGSGTDESFIAGDAITIDSNAGDLSAKGSVTAKFPINNLEGESKGPPTAKAAEFSYKDATHRALYTGTAKERARFESPDGIIYGVTIELLLSDDGRELKQMVVDSPSASGLMQARVAANRTALGDRLVHDVKTGKYLVTGSPARVIEKTIDKGVESCTDSRGTNMTFTKTGDPKDQGNFSVAPGQAGNATFNLKTCADWIIK